MSGRRTTAELALLAAALLLAQAAPGQRIEPPPPPRVDEGGPGQTVLARWPEDRREELEEIEEIVVVGDNRWRLPDLGSRWQNVEEEPGRIRVTFLPIYDPETPVETPDLFEVATEEQRIGYLELFRVRFGARGN